MTEDPKGGSSQDDIQRLVKEYVDLWEGQFKALAGDEALAKAMAQTMELMNAGAANVASMMQRTASSSSGGVNIKGADDVESDAKQSDQKTQSGTATAGATPGSSESDVRELTRRIAELEKRLARLEGLTELSGKVAPKKPRKS